ncbi:MAG: hypothetical protein U5N55_10105 [Cypionkella sp.]|nr:hypothetical protein [Cypionkella sp.]
MHKTARIARLSQLTDMVLDAKLAQLNKAAAQCQKTKQQIENLTGSAPEIGAGVGISDAITALNYQNWAEKRRVELGQILALQSAFRLDARDAAYFAFGRSRGMQIMAARVVASGASNKD